jgi:hypothetical protein
MRRRKRAEAPAGIPSPLEFFSLLRWLDGRPLLDTIEPYRRRILTEALFTFDAVGNPQYNLVLDGRGKRNHKTTDRHGEVAVQQHQRQQDEYLEPRHLPLPYPRAAHRFQTGGPPAPHANCRAD